MSVCAAPGTGGAFLAEMLAHLDCQAQTVGSSGYQALAAPNSPVTLALGALLTIFIALYGIRLLLGNVPTLSDTAIAFVKIGIVLTLASSWAAYRVVAYDVVLKAPAELFSSIGNATGLPGGDGSFAARLQGVDNGIVALTIVGSGRLDLSSLPQTGSVATNAAPMVVADGFALGTARVAYLGSTIAALGIVRLGGGLLLALAPLFAGFMLFEGTRFLFIGWLRMLIAIALGSLALTVVLSVETSILEPLLANVLAQRAASIATIAAPVELLVIALAFAIVLFGMIAIGMRIAWANVAPAMWMPAPSRYDVRVDRQHAERKPLAQEQPQILTPSRPQLLANAIDRTQQRYEGVGGWRGSSVAARTSDDVSEAAFAQTGAATTPLGQNYRRGARRVSGSGTARSARA